MLLRSAKYTPTSSTAELGSANLANRVEMPEGGASGESMTLSVPVSDSNSNNNNNDCRSGQFTAITSDSQLYHSSLAGYLTTNGQGLNKSSLSWYFNDYSRFKSTTNNIIESKSSKRFSTLEALPIIERIRYDNEMDGVELAKNLAEFGSLVSIDRALQQVERSLVKLIEESALANENKDFELALAKANEASDAFESLRAFINQKQLSSAPSSSENRKDGFTYANSKLTTRMNLFGLAVMVKSNLATQLNNNRMFGESIELFTELCRIANPASDAYGYSIVGSPTTELRTLLHRFGLNIGNIFYEMQDYKQALRHHRLTLDRLSSHGQRYLRTKLMNNITLSLIATGNQIDAITSLNLLLSDNLSRNSEISVKTNPANLEYQGGEGLVGVCNSNHHRFALNLMVCHYKRADLTSMTATLRDIVRVEICHQYGRVFDLADLINASKKDKDTTDRSKREPIARDPSSHVEFKAAKLRPSTSHALAEQRGLSSQIDRAQVNRTSSLLKQSTVSAMGAAQIKQTTLRDSPSTAGRDRIVSDSPVALTTDIDDPWGGSNKVITTSSPETASVQKVDELQRQTRIETKNVGRITKLSSAERTDWTMNAYRGDRLEMLIEEKHRQIYRALLMACNLMLQLESCNKFVANNLGLGTSVFQLCVGILTSSVIYESLVLDLKTNAVSMMLTKRSQLKEAVAMLKEIVAEQEKGNQRAARGRMLKSKVGNQSTADAKFIRPTFRSPLVTTNSILLHLLLDQTDRALACADFSLEADKCNVQRLINIANCHHKLGNLTLAEEIYRQALRIDSTCWEANYNLMLVSRNLGHDYCHSEPVATLKLCEDTHISLLLERGALLTLIQSALV